eukprot:2963730-Prymnesium_polylepis.2
MRARMLLARARRRSHRPHGTVTRGDRRMPHAWRPAMAWDGRHAACALAGVQASQYSTVVSCAITDVLLMGCTPLFAWPACRDMVRRHAGDLEEQRVRKDSAADMLCGCERGRVQAAAVVVVALLVAGATSGLIVWSFELDRAGFFEVFSGLLPGGSR